LEGALNWLLAGALTCAIKPAAQKILRVVTVTVAANKARIVRQRSARLSRVVVNAISLSHAPLNSVTQTLEANSEFTNSPAGAPRQLNSYCDKCHGNTPCPTKSCKNATPLRVDLKT
jgi:hypothetical protein